MNSKAIYEDAGQAAILLLPAVVLLLVFLYYPAIQTGKLSLFRSQFVGQQSQFIWFENFADLLSSRDYQNSIVRTFLFSVIVVVGSVSVSLGISYLIHVLDVGSDTYVLAAIWPYAMPPAVAATILMFLFHPSVGTITYHLHLLTGLSFNWRTNGPAAFALVSLATVWKSLGFNIIFLIAALQRVPDSLKDITNLTGVGHVTKLRDVYIPLISPTLVFLVVMNSIAAFFSSFSIIDIITKGGPLEATNILIYKLYSDAFRFNNPGQAAAESVILFSVVAILTVIQLRVSDEYAYYGA